MANLKPMTEDDMRQISGVGDRKMAAYGKEFLELIADYVLAGVDEDDFNPEDGRT